MNDVRGRPRRPASIGHLARDAAVRGGQHPFVTFYDDATAERTELSHATLHNWVSKTANLLVEELELEAGRALGVRLRTHWTTLVVLLAAWRAGLVVHRGGDLAALDALVLGEQESREAFDPARTVVVGSGMAGRVLADAGGALEFGQEVLAFADEFDDPDLQRDTPALAEPEAGGTAGPGSRGERTVWAHGDLLDLGLAAATELHLRPGARFLLSHPLETLAGVAGVLAGLHSDASVVLVAGADPSGHAERAATERCDLVVGPGAPRALRVERDGTGRLAAVAIEAAG